MPHIRHSKSYAEDVVASDFRSLRPRRTSAAATVDRNVHDTRSMPHDIERTFALGSLGTTDSKSDAD